VPIQAEISRKWRSLPYKIAALRDAHLICVLPPAPPGVSRRLPVKMLRGVYSNPAFQGVLAHLHCFKCGSPPVLVYLVAGHHRTFCHGPEPPAVQVLTCLLSLHRPC
jgi:hypothetical protein